MPPIHQKHKRPRELADEEVERLLAEGLKTGAEVRKAFEVLHPTKRDNTFYKG